MNPETKTQNVIAENVLYFKERKPGRALRWLLLFGIWWGLILGILKLVQGSELQVPFVLENICGASLFGFLIFSFLFLWMSVDSLLAREVTLDSRIIMYEGPGGIKELLVSELKSIETSPYGGSGGTGALELILVEILLMVFLKLFFLDSLTLKLSDGKNHIVLSTDYFSETTLRRICEHLQGNLDFQKLELDDKMNWFNVPKHSKKPENT